MDKVGFYINRRPVSISFTCPHCHLNAEICWTDLCVPDSWSDDWGAVLCPYCENEVELGEYDC